MIVELQDNNSVTWGTYVINVKKLKVSPAQPAKARRPDVAFIVETHAEMIVSSTTRHDGDLTMECDQFSQLYKVVYVTTM